MHCKEYLIKENKVNFQFSLLYNMFPTSDLKTREEEEDI